ncbi:hypothetical protein SDC9_08535 [bioreactor metagenome]|uniref:Hydrogenase 3 maturation protease n=1 Tax=bioreactor metagenome TaxID=1076179 RepID=A0A644T7K3_9ZZZZ|nr:hydrogenase maturation peptidase HycI [Methanobrevibacter sp.]MEA4957426.1 hydrogenase maturation peptidase HycI [Methanobrevibacter sp.]
MKKELESFLTNYDKLIIFGIGNELRGDDALGPYIINELENIIGDYNSSKKLKNNNSNSLIFIDGGSAPENFTGVIKKENPSHLLVIDAAFMKTIPGTVKAIGKEELSEVNASTHSMSLSYLIKYLEKELNFKFLLIGIEPFKMNLGDDISSDILKSADSVIDSLSSILLN